MDHVHDREDHSNHNLNQHATHIEKKDNLSNILSIVFEIYQRIQPMLNAFINSIILFLLT